MPQAVKGACPGCKRGALAPWWPGKGMQRAGHSLQRCLRCGGVAGTETALARLYGDTSYTIDVETGWGWIPKVQLDKLTVKFTEAVEEHTLGAEEAPENPLNVMATEHGLPFVEGRPRSRETPWMTRFAIAIILVSGALARFRPGWGESFELSRNHHGLIQFLTHAFLPAREASVALADLYCLLLFGAVAEEALGMAGFAGLYLVSSAFGGFSGLMLEGHARGFTAAAAALSAYFCLAFPRARIGIRLGFPGRRSPLDSWIRFPPLVWLVSWYLVQLIVRLWLHPELPSRAEIAAPLAAWGSGIVVGITAWVIRKVASSAG